MEDVISIKYNNKDFYYIRLGAFLEFFEKKLMYLVKMGDAVTPALKFDFEVESNLMYIDPLQVSVDPTICVVNRNLLIDGNNYPFAQNGDPFESPLLGKSYGQIMNIYLNMRYVLTKLDELKDANDNKVVLIDFINNILSAINSSLGGTTKLEAIIDDDRTTLVIIDGNPLPNLQEVIKVLNTSVPSRKISSEYVQFDLYGYNVENISSITAGFIKEFSFTTEITPALSTMLTVGATANSIVVGENSTAFSRFNAGLTDRFKEQIVESSIEDVTYIDSKTGKVEKYKVGNPFEEVGTGTVTGTEITGNYEEQLLINELAKKYVKTWGAYKEYLKRLHNGHYEEGEGATYKDAITNYNICLQQLKQVLSNKLLKLDGKPINSNQTSTPGTGFIPFNMSLTMDGLSGMKIYSKFLIDTKYLPANYPDNADFLIKGIEHKIENNKWTTNISSIVISQGTSNASGQVDVGGTDQNKAKIRTRPTKGPIGSNGNLADTSLKSIGIGNYKLSIAAANAFIKMAADIKKAGLIINVESAYRTFETQDSIFDWENYYATGQRQKINSNSAAAYPGTSNHGLGNAIDIYPPGVQEWIRINGVNYGWSWYEGRLANEQWHFTYDPNKKETWPNGPMKNGKKP
jgi:hypothetical protein